MKLDIAKKADRLMDKTVTLATLHPAHPVHMDLGRAQGLAWAAAKAYADGNTELAETCLRDAAHYLRSAKAASKR